MPMRLTKLPLFFSVLLIFTFMTCACGSSDGDSYQDRLEHTVTKLEEALRRVVQATAAAAAVISNAELQSTETRSILRGICSAEAAAIDCSTVNTDGILVAVEPSSYSSAEGADISEQEQWQRLRDSRQPVLSLLFKAVEGMWALDLEHPINDPSGIWLGSVSMLIDHIRLITGALASLPPDNRYQIMLMQPDGTILYDSDPEQIGRNTFNDPMYADFPSLLALAQRVVEQQMGSGSYQFNNVDSNEIITKEAIWRTVKLHETQWRVVLIRPETNE